MQVNYFWDGSREAFDPPLIDGVTVRNATSVGTSHLDPRSINSGKIPQRQCQTGMFTHSSLMQAIVKRVLIRRRIPSRAYVSAVHLVV